MKQICPYCHGEIENGYCPKCGQVMRAAAPVAPEADILPGPVTRRMNKANKIAGYCFAGVAAIIVAIVAATAIRSKQSFLSRYSSFVGEKWCTMGDDGTWMKLDTNPYDMDNYNMTSVQLLIETVNDELGFSGAVYQEMCETRAVDGRQSASNGKYEVSWTYHPDRGLEVLYQRK